jgi:hypothetical protein
MVRSVARERPSAVGKAAMPPRSSATSAAATELRAARRQRTGLVHEDGIDAACSLERSAALHEHAELGAAAGAHGHGGGRRETQRTGAGDHEHGDEPLDGGGEPRRARIHHRQRAS